MPGTQPPWAGCERSKAGAACGPGGPATGCRLGSGGHERGARQRAGARARARPSRGRPPRRRRATPGRDAERRTRRAGAPPRWRAGSCVETPRRRASAMASRSTVHAGSGSWSASSTAIQSSPQENPSRCGTGAVTSTARTLEGSSEMERLSSTTSAPARTVLPTPGTPAGGTRGGKRRSRGAVKPWTRSADGGRSRHRPGSGRPAGKHGRRGQSAWKGSRVSKSKEIGRAHV